MLEADSSIIPELELHECGCPYCGQGDWTPYQNSKLSKGLTYVQCLTCHLVHPHYRLDQDGLDYRASSHYANYEPPSSTAPTRIESDPKAIMRQFRWELGLLEHFLPIGQGNGLKVLEVGCGDGTLLAGLQGLGCEVIGIEPDPTMADVARSHDIDVVQKLFRPGIELPVGNFDLIIFRESLYHFFDLKQTLNLTRELLADDGYIYIKCFNVESLAIRNFAEASSGINGIDIPSNFSPQSLGHILDDSGFRVLDHLGFLEAPVGGYAMPWRIIRVRLLRYPRDLVNRILSYGLIRSKKNRNFAVVAQRLSAQHE